MRSALPAGQACAAAVLAALLGATGCGAPGRPAATGPNLLLVVVDTLRADRLTQYGHHRDTSSGLARLTRAATRFDECYSTAPWTAPAVASLFTGLTPARHGVDAVGAALPLGAPTLAADLQAAGWRTGAITFNPHVTRDAGFDPGFGDFFSYRGLARRAPDIRAMTDRALEWIDDVTGDGERSFFLYLQPMNVHGPYSVPDDARSALLGRPPRTGFEFFGPLMHELMNEGRTERREDVTPEMLASLREQYDTAVHYTADELGAFFDGLAERGLWDDTLVVLTADHGEELFDHGGFAHRYSLHREVLRVPLFVKLPGQRRAREVARPVSLVDLRATVAELLGLPVPETDGRSLAPLLRPDEDAPARKTRPFVAQASNEQRFVGRSLRKGDEELIVIERSYDGLRDAVRLYDLASDPEQQNDLAAERPGRVARLREELERLEAGYRGVPLEPRSYEIDPDLRDLLDSLGYL